MRKTHLTDYRDPYTVPTPPCPSYITNYTLPWPCLLPSYHTLFSLLYIYLYGCSSQMSVKISANSIIYISLLDGFSKFPIRIKDAEFTDKYITGPWHGQVTHQHNPKSKINVNVLCEFCLPAMASLEMSMKRFTRRNYTVRNRSCMIILSRPFSISPFLYRPLRSAYNTPVSKTSFVPIFFFSLRVTTSLKHNHTS